MAIPPVSLHCLSMRLLASVLLLACARPAVPPADAAIGVHTELLADSSRHGSDSTTARLIQLTVWYPAHATAGAPRLTYGDYFDLAATERGAPNDSARRADRGSFGGFLLSKGVADTGAFFAAPMRAVRDAAGAGGSHPLVVIVQGNGQSAADQSALAEELAAGGYVVATMPSYTRISHPPASESELGTGAEEQAADIAFVVAAARRRTDVDAARLGLVAHSLGARGALLYAMRGGVRALVSLDGGIGTATGRAAMEGTPSFAARRLATPVLHFYETLDPFMTPDFALFGELRDANVTLALTTAMHHHHFTSLGALGSRVRGLAAATGGSDTTTGTWLAMSRLTRAFLDEHVRGEAGAFAQAASLPQPAGAMIRLARLDFPGR
jgi:dienelactone hydrolase